MFGKLSETQCEQIRTVVRGRRVHDLGAGDCGHAERLVQWGATEVVAVDKAEYSDARKGPKISFVRAYFDEYAKTNPILDLVFLAWPMNYDSQGLVQLVAGAKTIVYLGKNTDMCMCGTPTLFQYFVCRKLEGYVPDPINTLIVLGKPLTRMRKPTGEELAGLSVYEGQAYSFDLAERLAGSRAKHA